MLVTLEVKGLYSKLHDRQADNGMLAKKHLPNKYIGKNNELDFRVFSCLFFSLPCKKKVAMNLPLLTFIDNSKN